jgi:hypothetical protein
MLTFSETFGLLCKSVRLRINFQTHLIQILNQTGAVTFISTDMERVANDSLIEDGIICGELGSERGKPEALRFPGSILPPLEDCECPTDTDRYHLNLHVKLHQRPTEAKVKRQIWSHFQLVDKNLSIRMTLI